MAIALGDIKKLRDMTSAGMMDCKKALDLPSVEIMRPPRVLS